MGKSKMVNKERVLKKLHVIALCSYTKKNTVRLISEVNEVFKLPKIFQCF